MRRHLWRYQWVGNERDCPGAVPYLKRAYLVVAFPWIIASEAWKWKRSWPCDSWRFSIGVARLYWTYWWGDFR